MAPEGKRYASSPSTLARQPRFDVPLIPQHVIQRGNNRQDIFRAFGDYDIFLRWLAEAIAAQGVSLHAYVLMTNHIHLLATPLGPGSIGKIMQTLGRRYVQFFNSRYNRTGSLWEGRYRATVIDSEEYFLTCSRYIEQNPVRAGISQSPADYRWSSFRHNALGHPDSLLTHNAIYDRLGQSPEERREGYRAISLETISEEVSKAIREATAKAWALGGDAFQQQVQELTGRRTQPLRSGRPPKIRV